MAVSRGKTCASPQSTATWICLRNPTSFQRWSAFQNSHATYPKIAAPALDHRVALAERDQHALRGELDAPERPAFELGGDVLGGQLGVGERGRDDRDGGVRLPSTATASPAP